MKKRLFYVLMALMFLFSITASALPKKETNSLLNDLRFINDEGVQSQLELTTKYGVLKETKEVYAKIIEDPNKIGKTVLRTYSKQEYLKEIEKDNILSSELVTTLGKGYTGGNESLEGWIRLIYEIYDLSQTTQNKISIYVAFEWLKVPSFQLDDYFVLGHDSHSVFPGSTELGSVRFTYWPSKAHTSLSKTYNGSIDRSDLISGTDRMGFNFPIVPSSLVSQGLNIGAIMPDASYSSYRTKGLPKGILSFTAYKGNSYDLNTNMGLAYGHKQAGLNVDPTISVNSLGMPDFTGFTATLIIDEVSTPIRLEYY